MDAQIGYDPGNFYAWRASDGFAIHLSLNLVTQLTSQISRAGTASQPGGLRGILLGRSIDAPLRATVIDDFKLIPAGADATEPPEYDEALFEIAQRMVESGNDRRVVGFFRARRDGRLSMGPRDIKTFSRLFGAPGNVALLIQTSKRGNESDAALFYWQDGSPQPHDFGFAFPLDAGQLASGHPGWRYPDPLDFAPTPASAPAPAPAPILEDPRWTPPPAGSPASREGIRWSRLLPTAALVAICVGALQLATNSSRTVAAASAPVEAAAGLGLTVTSRPHQLEIRWNRQSAVIAASDKGVMKITDDGITEIVPFDQSQLSDGYVAYTPKTTDVSIRLEVTGKDGGTTSESIRSVAIP
jgi:hypothetical protein